MNSVTDENFHFNQLLIQFNYLNFISDKVLAFDQLMRLIVGLKLHSSPIINSCFQKELNFKIAVGLKLHLLNWQLLVFFHRLKTSTNLQVT